MGCVPALVLGKRRSLAVGTKLPLQMSRPLISGQLGICRWTLRISKSMSSMIPGPSNKMAQNTQRATHTHTHTWLPTCPRSPRLGGFQLGALHAEHRLGDLHRAQCGAVHRAPRLEDRPEAADSPRKKKGPEREPNVPLGGRNKRKAEGNQAVGSQSHESRLTFKAPRLLAKGYAVLAPRELQVEPRPSESQSTPVMC